MYRQRGLATCERRQKQKRIVSKKNEIEEYTQKMDDIIEAYLMAQSNIKKFANDFNFVLSKVNKKKNSNVNEKSNLFKFGESMKDMCDIMAIFDKEYNKFVGRIIDGSHMSTDFAINHHIWAYESFIAWLITKRQLKKMKRKSQRQLCEINKDCNINISKLKKKKDKRREQKSKNEKRARCEKCSHRHCRCFSNNITVITFSRNTQGTQGTQGRRGDKDGKNDKNDKNDQSFVNEFEKRLSNVILNLKELTNDFDQFFNESLLLSTETRDNMNENNNDSLLYSLKSMENLQAIMNIYQSFYCMIEFEKYLIELKDYLDDKIELKLNVFKTSLSFNFRKQIIIATNNSNENNNNNNNHNSNNESDLSSILKPKKNVVKKLGDFNNIGKILSLLNGARW